MHLVAVKGFFDMDTVRRSRCMLLVFLRFAVLKDLQAATHWGGGGGGLRHEGCAQSVNEIPFSR